MSTAVAFVLRDLSGLSDEELERLWVQTMAAGDAAFAGGARLLPVSVQERAINAIVEMVRRGIVRMSREEMLREYLGWGFEAAFAALDERERERGRGAWTRSS